MPAACRQVVAVLLLSAVGAVAQWARPAAPWRRVLQVEDGPGGTVTTVLFRPANANGSRPILVDAKGGERPYGVAETFGGAVRIWFKATGGETLHAYFAPGDLPTTTPPRPGGLLHEVRTYDGAIVEKLADFQQFWDAAAEVQGAEFVARIYTSTNPFGPNAGSLHRWDGNLRLPQDGKWTFCTASSDASFLLIDGREIVAWPGRHPAKDGLGGEHRGTVDLKAGVHRLTYLQANGAVEGFAIAAVVPPGEKAHVVIPEDWFVPAAFAYVGPLERRDGQPAVDFVPEQERQLCIDDRELFALGFTGANSGDLPAGAVWAWDFGDDTHGTGQEVEHLYFKTGVYPVKLTVTGGDRTWTMTQEVAIRRRYDITERDDKPAMALIRRGLQQEAAAGIQPEGYATLVHYCFFYLLEDLGSTFAERCLAARDRVPDADVFTCFHRLGLELQHLGEQYERAAECFRVVQAREPDPQRRASSALHFAGMLNLCLNQPREARQLLDDLAGKRFVESWEPRLLQVYRGDTALVLDGLAAAGRVYQDISPAQPLIVAGKLDRLELARDQSRYFHLRNILEQGLYEQALEELDILEWEDPPERLNPATNLLKAEALVGNDQPRKAAVCLERALLARADMNYQPRLRLELARLYFRLGRLPEASVQARLIGEEDPWSREQVDARKLLDDIDAKRQ